jgi:hypothetical protein
MKSQLVARLAQNLGGQARGRQQGTLVNRPALSAQNDGNTGLSGQLPGHSDSLTAEGLSMSCHWCYLTVMLWRPSH